MCIRDSRPLQVSGERVRASLRSANPALWPGGLRLPPTPGSGGGGLARWASWDRGLLGLSLGPTS
eukprot:11484143-Alexandrium_andersonii.AAC.1